MLSNNADAFFTTPMPTTITTQAREASAGGGMPSPRPLSQSATATAAVPAFLPGIGGYVNSPAYAGSGVSGIMDTIKSNWMLVAGIAAAGLLFTAPGKRLRAKMGF
jgi:hypothetical protein